MAPLRYAAKFEPFLSLDCAPTPSTLAQSKERKEIKFCHLATLHDVPDGARACDEVVDEVGWDPDHGGEGDAEPHALRPAGVLVVVVRHRGVGDDVVSEHALPMIIPGF